MDRKQIVLAAMSTGNCDLYTPVQVQKLFFLIDRNVAEKLQGHAFFNFEPYNYGPFDREVYTTLNELTWDGYVETVPQGTWTSYKLTDKGQDIGAKILDSIPENLRNYIRNVSQFVRKLSFSELVRAIYKKYPEMRVNSAFQY